MWAKRKRRRGTQKSRTRPGTPPQNRTKRPPCGLFALANKPKDSQSSTKMPKARASPSAKCRRSPRPLGARLRNAANGPFTASWESKRRHGSTAPMALASSAAARLLRRRSPLACLQQDCSKSTAAASRTRRTRTVPRDHRH